MRIFIAINANELSFDPLPAFKKVKTNLLRKEIEHRWVPLSNYHCTLNFLGEVDPVRIDELMPVIKEVSAKHEAFNLKLSGMDAFPEIKHGRVLYVGVQNSIKLRELQKDCEDGLKSAGFSPEERPYVPHLTVGRLRNPRNLSDIISPLKNTEFGMIYVRAITLFESVSGGSFPVYRPLQVFPLLNVTHER